MKKILLLLAVVTVATAFKLTTDKAAAVTEQVNGIHVFAYSKPSTKYDILGTVKVKGIVSSEDGPHMVELLTQYAKRDHPSGEAIIVGSNFEKAEVIRFKD